MPFPISARGKVSVELPNGTDIPAMISAVEDALHRARASAIQRDAERITFRGGIFRLVTNWNILVSVSSGAVRFVRSDHVVVMRYYISFVQMFVIVTVMFTAVKFGSWPWGPPGARIPWGPLLIG